MAEDKKPAEETPAANEETEPAAERDGEPNFDNKHFLEHKWTLWFDNPSGKQTVQKFGQGLRSIFTFETVEDFWCLYNNIKAPSLLSPSATYFLFKDGIVPKWEDPRNAQGGCWTANVPKTANSKQTLDQWWLHSVLACIGEQYAEGDEICGVCVNIRGQKDRIELWTKTASNEAVQVSVGKDLKSFLDMADPNARIGFSVFSEKLGSAAAKARDRYQV